MRREAIHLPLQVEKPPTSPRAHLQPHAKRPALFRSRNDETPDRWADMMVSQLAPVLALRVESDPRVGVGGTQLGGETAPTCPEGGPRTTGGLPTASRSPPRTRPKECPCASTRTGNRVVMPPEPADGQEQSGSHVPLSCRPKQVRQGGKPGQSSTTRDDTI
jgi:hypothetical protein